MIKRMIEGPPAGPALRNARNLIGTETPKNPRSHNKYIIGTHVFVGHAFDSRRPRVVVGHCI